MRNSQKSERKERPPKRQTNMQTIAIVEDDTYISDLLYETLTAEGYAVIRAWSGTEALLLFQKAAPDLILLDLMLPGLSGEALLPHIKRIPVIVLSAKAGTDDKVKLLLEGASDYLTKPFEMRELLARIAVQLRKRAADNAPLLSAANLTLNTDTRELTVAERPVHLTRTEFAILKNLLQNPAQVISKSTLLDKISLDSPDCMESSLKVHISNLRRKLKEAGAKVDIEAVWGIGFRLLFTNS